MRMKKAIKIIWKECGAHVCCEECPAYETVCGFKLAMNRQELNDVAKRIKRIRKERRKK